MEGRGEKGNETIEGVREWGKAKYTTVNTNTSPGGNGGIRGVKVWERDDRGGNKKLERENGRGNGANRDKK